MFRTMGPLQSELRLEIRSDEALTLETSALKVFHGGNSTKGLITDLGTFVKRNKTQLRDYMTTGLAQLSCNREVEFCCV